uniref:Uncharacterized protein n=1 Tax=Panagrolaimus davidi TaxID=227884 RepID=A0A914PK16_9BILA
MKNHYVKLRTYEADIIEWFMLLCDVNDIDFVKENVENRLGQDYFSVKLWRLYLAFLKERGEYKSLLETYSKYCRFFLDDLKMKEQYKNATIQYGQIKLPWDNLFDFEGENVIEEAKEESEVGMKEVVSFDKNLCASFYDTLQNQDFALPGPLIFYLLKNADNRMLRKLFASCKYFFAKQSTPICYRFDTGLDTTFYDENLCLDYNANPSLFFNNIYITGSLNVVQHPKFLSNLMPRIYRCDAKHIYLNSQALTFNELKFFIQHGKVVEMDLPNSQILDGNGDCVNLEAFLEYLPAIEILSLPKVKTNSKTGHALAKLKFTGNLSSLSIAKIVGEPFDPIEFQKFVVANKFVHFSMKFKFATDFDGAFVEKFKQVMKESFGEENVYIIKLRF